MSYEEYFRKVCGRDRSDPYPFQVRFAHCDADFRVLEVPTGLGKTLTVVGDWMFKKQTTRLVYCLPGRALTSQVAGMLKELHLKEIEIFELMGGSEDLHKKIRPNQRAIIIGTQDVLVSRALNRGYALLPYRWPMDFGLLNNDVTWVFDEVQLLGEVVATGAQLAAFWKQFGTFGRNRCVWMTATLERDWLKTIDFRSEEPVVIGLDENDHAVEAVRKRTEAQKAVVEAQGCDMPADCAAFVKRKHRNGHLTLVIANTVARAQEIWSELVDRWKVPAELLHSRFRSCDREGKVDTIVRQQSGVIVATQVIEAGIDMDADLMITDVAPWFSIVQRFGRVNRKGEKPHARIFWVRNPQQGKKAKSDGSQFLPYDAHEVQKAIAELEKLHSAAPDEIAGRVKAPVPYQYVLRKQDLMDLFDTTPDLAGNQIDVSRFVRSGDETNVYVAWRSWEKEQDPPKQSFVRDELCPVPFSHSRSEFREWLRKNPAWTWNYTKKGKWEKVDPERVYPGMRLLVRSEAGAYLEDKGWFPESKKEVPEFAFTSQPEPSNDSDPDSEKSVAQSLDAHTNQVVAELDRLCDCIGPALNGKRNALMQAARLHDWGKAHPVFQQTLHNFDEPPETAPNPLLAKQDRKESRNGGHSRVGFRHELASALAALKRGADPLPAYLIAAHHGKVRMNIRSVEEETQPNGDERIARGVQDGDKLFAADLGGDEYMPEVELNLAAMELGEGSWSDQVAKLLDSYGPFRLAFLELLLRSADERASEEQEK